MKNINILSMRSLGIYFLLFAMVCGIATFVENAHSTEVAKQAIYNTKWFEGILLLSAISLQYNIIVFKLYTWKKLPIGLFHLAFVFMIAGAAITRYTGEEGKMHIREGESLNFYMQQDEKALHKAPLPFSIGLEKFEIEYYPGSQNPSEYRSHILLSENGAKVMSYEIYMNHILKYKGYRFFQSSYDQDLKGTILSVNHDPWGMGVTYFGYLMLFLGMLLSLFAKESRFQTLLGALKTNKSAIVVLLLLCLPALNYATPSVDKQTAQQFGELWISNGKGRILPLHTHNLNLIKKLSHERSYKGLNADEVILSIMTYPEMWKKEALIKIDEHLAEKLRVNNEYLSYSQFFNANGEYLLINDIRIASAKALNERNKTDKAIVNITERVSIFRMILDASFLSIYPKDEAWLSPSTVSAVHNNDYAMTNDAFLSALESRKAQDISLAISGISQLQIKYGVEEIPSNSHKNVEILYNKLNVFTRLAPYYATLAILLLIVAILSIVRQKKSKAINVFKIALLLGFALQTLGIIMRWYISGRAPMGNGYESMLIVSWASILGGIFFAKKSPITLAISTILAAATLLVAHINTMNPEITALVPVLNSYWLSSHVASITASYGLLSISALLGLFNISLLAFSSKPFDHVIEELTTISKLLMIVGLYLLTIGCFIGAIWANESWGRYWSWDPKETWCLITILVYSFIIHMHHVPQLASNFAYNVSSVWAISSIIMTYFGVNYFLGGMHSYAGGQAPSIPMWSFFALWILLFISIWAGINVRNRQKDTLS